MVKLNVTLDEQVVTGTKSLFKEYKDIFAWMYVNLKGIPPHIT